MTPTKLRISQTNFEDGWTPVTDSWSYASASTITVPSGAASKYQKGDRIKLTQTTVKYFYIIGVADTVLTVTGGSNYTVANAAISAISYSHQSSPVGFPSYFALTSPTWTTSGTAFTNTPPTNTFKIVINSSVITVTAEIGTHATSGGTGIFYAQLSTSEIPNFLMVVTGAAMNISDNTRGLCNSTNGVNGKIGVAKYDNTAIAGSSQYFSFSISYIF